MAYEIERKFLVNGESYKEMAFASNHIVQGYISKDPERTVRIRIKDNDGYITIKGKSTDDGLSRFEWEKRIPLDEAQELMKLCDGSIIDKIRYKVNSDNHIFEIDEFFGDNNGLVFAEVELSNTTEQVKLPHFIGKEVTGDIHYYNSYIAENPYNSWK